MALFAEGSILGEFLGAEPRQGPFADLLQRMIDSGKRIGVIETYKGWMDVDTLADLERADIREEIA